jgi:hypothetical protein
MKLAFGDKNNPTGNAVIYWLIKGNNRLVKDAEIIASNIVISPLQFHNETLMVNFPPILIKSLDRLIKIAEKNNIDLIVGGEIDVPEDITDFSSFYKKQIEKYNGIIQEYLLAYKEKNSGKGKEKEDEKNLPELISQAGDIMENVRKLVKQREKRSKINVKIDELRKIQEYFNREMRGFDLTPIIRYIDRPDHAIDSLVDLYLRKFFAIFLEDYEQADNLKNEIIKIENSLSR